MQHNERIKLWMIISIMVALCIGVGLWIYGHLETYCIVAPHIDTQFAQEYTDDGFRQIAVHMTQKDVLALVGRPLFTLQQPDIPARIEEIWYYSKDGKCWWGDFAWEAKRVNFQHGQVISTESQWYYD